MNSNFCRYVAIAAMTMLGSASAEAQDAQAAIKKAQYAIGMIRGPQRIDAIGTMEYWGAGTSYSYGQAFKPDGPWPPAKITYHASLSYAVPAMRIDATRSNPDGPIQGGGGFPLAAPRRQIEVVSGAFAWNESVPGGGFIKGTTATPAPGATSDRLLQLWSTPHGALKAAERARAEVNLSIENGKTVLTFALHTIPPNFLAGDLTASVPGGPSVTMKVILNAKDQPERVETRTDDPILGDLVTDTVYTDYKNLDEIQTDVLFPAHVVQTRGGFPVLDLTISKADTNNPYVVFPVPDNVEKAPTTAPTAKVDTQEISKGVFYLTGGSHHSLAADFGRYIVLVECPLTEERAMAVIDAAKKAIPNKPIRYVVNTHHHFDHTGGLRACMAEGATILTQSANKPYYEKLAAMPHTINPDRLTKSGTKPVIEGFDDKRVLTGGGHTMELYRVQGSNHADTMLIAYMPKEKVLVDADIFTPAPTGVPLPPPTKEMLNLDANLLRLKLDVQQIAPIHGRLVTIGDFRTAIGH